MHFTSSRRHEFYSADISNANETFLFVFIRLQVSLYQVYLALKPFGLIIEAYEDFEPDSDYRTANFVIERSNESDKLKPARGFAIDDDMVLVQWQRNKYVKTKRMRVAAISKKPPNSDESTHFHDLNDDCMAELFTYVDVFDLCSLGHVYSRSRELAQKRAESRLESLELKDNNWTPLWKFERMLRMHGATIDNVKVNSTQCSDLLMALISKYCTKLEEYTGRISSNQLAPESIPLVRRVAVLDLYCSGRLDGILSPEGRLQSLAVTAMVDDLPPVRLPELLDIEFRTYKWGNIASVMPFFALNRQMLCLTIHVNMPAFDIEHILRHLRHLRHLQFDPGSSIEQGPTYRQNLVCSNPRAAFSRLTELETLRLFRIDVDMMEDMLQAVIDNDIKLKQLALYHDDESFVYPIDRLCRVKSLEYVWLVNMDVSHLERIAENCLALKRVGFIETRIQLRDVLKFLKRATKVTKAMFDVHSPYIDLNEDILDALTMLQEDRPLNLIVDFVIEDSNQIPVNTYTK